MVTEQFGDVQLCASDPGTLTPGRRNSPGDWAELNDDFRGEYHGELWSK